MKQLMLMCIPPFEGFSSDDFLGGGGCGFVDLVDDEIAFKYTPKHHVDADPDDPNRELEIRREKTRMEERERCMRIEKENLLAFDADPHPHVLQSLLHVPHGIFMPRLRYTLEHRLKPDQGTICKKSEIQWARGIASGAAWLEGKGFVHGDIRPPNVLLDLNEDVKLCDFDCSVKIGEWLIANTLCYTNPHDDAACAQSDLFAIGSVVYNIITRRVVFDDTDDDEEIQKRFRSGDFPPVKESSLGPVIQRCWTSAYDKVAQLAEETRQIYNQTPCGVDRHAHTEASILGPGELERLKKRCERYCADPSLLEALKEQQFEERQARTEPERLMSRMEWETVQTQHDSNNPVHDQVEQVCGKVEMMRSQPFKAVERILSNHSTAHILGYGCLAATACGVTAIIFSGVRPALTFGTR